MSLREHGPTITICSVCQTPIHPDRVHHERGEPVHADCKQGWGM